MLNLDLIKNQSHEISKLIQTDTDEQMEIARSSELILPSIKNTLSHNDDSRVNNDDSLSSPKM